MNSDSKSDASGAPSIGWSGFARGRHERGGRHTWFDGPDDELMRRIAAGWPRRRPGQGRTDLEQVVVVPVDPAGFVGTTVRVDETTPLRAGFDRRRPDEAGFVRVTAEGEPEPVRHAAAVLYSAAALLENGGVRSTGCDWEIVCLLAGPRESEPMDPLTMARNFLQEAGGTFADYSARDFAEAIWYWSCRAPRHLNGASNSVDNS